MHGNLKSKKLFKMRKRLHHNLSFLTSCWLLFRSSLPCLGTKCYFKSNLKNFWVRLFFGLTWFHMLWTIRYVFRNLQFTSSKRAWIHVVLGYRLVWCNNVIFVCPRSGGRCRLVSKLYGCSLFFFAVKLVSKERWKGRGRWQLY